MNIKNEHFKKIFTQKTLEFHLIKKYYYVAQKKVKFSVSELLVFFPKNSDHWSKIKAVGG
ncbi:MAG: hypothetical protein CM15mP22_0390 [Gammaproteobacteria bacterium]|nr:MAG: hypothetical protein CM15mP22_0390 [Gammaproteobacteria bacterium]